MRPGHELWVATELVAYERNHFLTRLIFVRKVLNARNALVQILILQNERIQTFALCAPRTATTRDLPSIAESLGTLAQSEGLPTEVVYSDLFALCDVAQCNDPRIEALLARLHPMNAVGSARVIHPRYARVTTVETGQILILEMFRVRSLLFDILCVF